MTSDAAWSMSVHDDVPVADAEVVDSGLGEGEGAAHPVRRQGRGDGTLEVTGRGDGIDVDGHTVPAADVERVLRSVPGAGEVVCVPGTLGRAGTRVVAVLPQTSPELVAAMRAAARRDLPAPL